jgi:hypothetical protein
MLDLDHLSDLGRYVRRTFRQPLENLGLILPGMLLIGTGALFAVIAFSPQAHEIFRVMLEHEKQTWPEMWWEIIISALSVMFLSALLFFTYHAFLLRAKARLRQTKAAWMDDGPFMGLLSKFCLFLLPSAPWLGCLWSVLCMREDLEKAKDPERIDSLPRLIKDAIDAAPNKTAAEAIEKQGNAVVHAMNSMLDRSILAILAIGVLWLFTLAALGFWLTKRKKRRSAARLVGPVFSLAAAGYVFVFGMLAAVSGETFNGFYEAAGPLASIMLTAAGLFAMAVAFTAFTRALGLATYFGALLLILLSYGLALYYAENGSNPGSNGGTDLKVRTFKDEAIKWIGARRAQRSDDGKIPFLIVSAQGGGVYAAVESSLFLARLQDAEKQFKNSLFAISSVSGGSIGASLFHLAANGKCGAADKDNKIEKQISELALTPYLPVIAGNITADVMRRLISITTFRIDRAEAFKARLIKACSAFGEAYEGQWKPDGSGPALVLNTTWMSNGHRVAFAPFGLRIGDGTLWSFGDLYSGLNPLRRGQPFEASLAEAVVASARFPGALPALSLTVGDHHHNFGDGGYADASGVATSTDMFQEAMQLEGRYNIDPRLIMLTFDYPEADPKTEQGTRFVETIAPASAILGVRDNLAGQAITRAQSKSHVQDQVLRVSLNPDKYGIALGFQLSRTSYETLSLLIGRPEWCKDVAYKGENTIVKNSCVAKKVLYLVQGR